MTLSMESIASYMLVLCVGAGGWLATHLVGKPFLTYRDLRAEVARCLILYANIYCPPVPDAILPPRTAEARNKCRGLASELMAVANSIWFYRIWSRLGILPKWKELEEVKGNLIGLSNSIGEPNQSLEISKREDTIRRLLQIK